MIGDVRLLGLSKSARYALQGLIHLASRQGDGRVLVENAARALDLPPSFLAKLFQRMARKGLLASHRGPRGGYVLARAPELITLADVVSATQEPMGGRRECLLESGGCAGDGFCAIHEDVVAAERRINDALSRITLAAAVRSGSLTGGEHAA
ncbi:MAG: BadM/Rrf2 family transcriptional regulator [Elusimicrobia bacterium]|nr:MAG: BadM/Rrf2 family transcriptional regulator [Elusimicrobiota bacterium]